MKEYIERDAAEQAKPEFLNEKVEDYEKAIYAKGWNNCNTQYRENILSIPTVDAVPVVRCLECKHRPTKPEKYDDGLDLVFPDEACPCYCDNDPFYSWYPSDDWFCPRGERKGGEQQ